MVTPRPIMIPYSCAHAPGATMAAVMDERIYERSAVS